MTKIIQIPPPLLRDYLIGLSVVILILSVNQDSLIKIRKAQAAVNLRNQFQFLYSSTNKVK